MQLVAPAYRAKGPGRQTRSHRHLPRTTRARPVARITRSLGRYRKATPPKRHHHRPNLGVTFDPANMILYDKGDPVEALRTLGPWIRQVHIKDARRTKVPGTWGQEVPVGAGEVDWPACFAALDKLKFAGDLVIEREAGSQRVPDIRQAREVLRMVFC